MNKLFKKVSKLKSSQLQQELMRAHLIITLLSLVGIILLALGATLSESLDANLSIIAGVGLSMLAIVSLFVSYCLSNYKK